MKRFFFSVITLMVAATSCTESGIIDMPEFYQNPIVFDTYIGNTPITKAEDIDVGYLQKETGEGGGVQVYAFKSPLNNTNKDYVDYNSTYLDGQLLYSASNWLYYEDNTPTDAYMPTSKDLAVVAHNLNASGYSYMSNISADKTEFDFTINNTVANQLDLLVSPLTFISETGETTRVPLRFYHLLSRIGFKVLSSGGANTQIIFESIKIVGAFPTKGHVDMTLSTATPSGTSISLTGTRKPAIDPILTDYTYEYNLLGNTGYEISATNCYPTAQQIRPNGNNCYMMLMPGQVGDVNGKTPHIEVRYSIAGEDRKSTIWLTKNQTEEGENWTFEAGKAYEFVLKLTTATIDFTADVIQGEWVDPQTPTPLN